jgi:hypothetical protein
MSDDEFSGVQKKIMAWLLIGVLGGNALVITLNKANPDMRSDPFTGTDAEELEADMRSYIDHKFVIHKLQIPPQATRSRVFALEEWARGQDPSFRRPTSNW